MNLSSMWNSLSGSAITGMGAGVSGLLQKEIGGSAAPSTNVTPATTGPIVTTPWYATAEKYWPVAAIGLLALGAVILIARS